jgi:glycosyltransferase involved in cell wall biosynthesis
VKIALVTMQLGPRYRHGTERYVATLGSALRARGHRVLALAGDPLGNGRLPFATPRDGEADLLAHPSQGWMTVRGRGLRGIGAWLARERPDLVHLVNPAQIGVGTALESRRLGIPVVVTAVDFWWICPRATLLHRGESICDGSPGWRECLRCVAADHPRTPLRRLGGLPDALAPLALALFGAGALARRTAPSDVWRWTGRRELLRQLLDGLDQLIFPSAAMRDALAPRLAHARWSVISYGLEPEWFERPCAPGARRKTPEELTLGYAGSLQAHKGADLLLEAVRQLGWVHTSLRLAGGPDDPAYRRRLARAASGLSVEFTGPLGPREMRAFLRSLDLLVLPSRWPENRPFVLLEAQAAGLPVLASDVPGVADRIPDRRLLFEPGSPRDLARALRGFCEDPPAAIPPPVPTADEMASATAEVYREVLERRRAEALHP